MRISNAMGYSTLHTNIARLQEDTYYNQIRKATGKDIVNIAQAPSRLMDVKKIIAQMNMKENYIDANDYAISEMRFAEDQVAAIAEAMQQIRDLSVSSTNPSYDGSVVSIGTFIKGIMTDIIRNANADFNGKYAFSGTKTRPSSILDDYPDMTNMPFELIEGPSTPENFSGFSVIFKGNMENRIINKDSHSQEVINMNAIDLFGAGGVEFFQPIIDLYNVLIFTREGEVREIIDGMDRAEKQRVNELQTIVANNVETLNKNVAIFASRRVRIDTVTTQLREEVTRLDEVKSLKEDADMGKLLSDLAKEEIALQFTLSIGATIQKYSLFDFLR